LGWKKKGCKEFLWAPGKGKGKKDLSPGRKRGKECNKEKKRFPGNRPTEGKRGHKFGASRRSTSLSPFVRGPAGGGEGRDESFPLRKKRFPHFGTPKGGNAQRKKRKSFLEHQEGGNTLPNEKKMGGCEHFFFEKRGALAYGTRGLKGGRG